MLAQYEEATTAGRPLHLVPLLEASTIVRRAEPGRDPAVTFATAQPRLVEGHPADLAFVIAHELSHVLPLAVRERVGGRPVLPVGSGLATAGVGG